MKVKIYYCCLAVRRVLVLLSRKWQEKAKNSVYCFTEYQRRLDENLRVCDKYNIPFIDLEYDNELWWELIKGYENEPERGKRCDICFNMRLKRSMEYASQNGFTAVASVLGVSRYKNLDRINEIGEKTSEEMEMPYIHIEGRKNGMQELRHLIIKEMKLYNQNYCGCNLKGEIQE